MTMLRIDAHAEQRRRVADAQLEVGHGPRIGAAADRVLVVVEHANRHAPGAPAARPLTKASIGPVAARRRMRRSSPSPRTSALRTTLHRAVPPSRRCDLVPRRRVSSRRYSRSKSAQRSAARQLLARRRPSRACTTWLNSICSRRGSSRPYSAFEQVRDAALARLAVDADHRVVAAARGPSGRSAGTACPRCRPRVRAANAFLIASWCEPENEV